MTGANVVFPSMAAAAALVSPPRAAPRYSIDAFSEFSVFALSRTPTTAALTVTDVALPERRSTLEQDEELFRDLFAADNDWDAPPGSHKNALLHQHKAVRAPAPAFWSSTGSPFLTSSTFANPLAPVTPVATENPELTRTAPVPRLNLAELLKAQPGDDGDVTADNWGGRLDQVAETEDEDSDERPESDTEPPRSVKPAKLKSSSCGGSNNTKLQQETLRFLEKLDLKALLHTPRPDVLDFYPASTLGAPGVGAAAIATGSVAATNPVVSGVEDARVEHERVPVSNALKAKLKQKNQSSSGSSKKENPEMSSRLAYMETTYGTTKNETRKTRKGTIERLANPILGYTSTLQALAPEQRRKREMAIGEDGWDPCARSPATSKVRKKGARTTAAKSGLEHLTSPSRIYEAAAAASSSAMHQRTRESSFAGLSNNQLDDQRETQAPTKRQDPIVKKDNKLAGARKAALKKKFEQQLERPDATTGEQRVGSTFLTQHEDEEAKISSRGKRLQPARTAAALSTLACQQRSELESRQPRPPASVRGTKSTQPARAHSSEGKTESRESTAQQKLKRSSGQQQPQAPSGAPRRPSNSDRGRTTSRRPFSRAVQSSAADAAGSAKANTTTVSSKTESTPVASVPKRKPSGGKPPSAAALLLMGPDATAQPFSASAPTPSKRGGSFNGRQPRKPQSTEAATPARTAYTPRKPVSANSRGNSATKDAATSGRRSRRPSRDAGGSDRASEGSVTLPAIPSVTARTRQSSEPSARRKEFINLRPKAS